MSTNVLAFYAACTAILLFALAAIVVPLLRRRGRQATRDSAAAQIRVYRDQLRELQRELAGGTLSAEQFASARRELEGRLAKDLAGEPPGATAAVSSRRWRVAPSLAIAAALVVLLPAGAWWLYARLGAPAAVVPAAAPGGAATATTAPAAGAKGAPLPNMDDLAQRLALRLRTQAPDDGEGWALLARSYVELKRHREAADAFAQAVKRIPNDATLLADYADALGMANGKTLKGEPAALALRALKADPKQPKALALAASAAFEEKNYRQAIAYWQKLKDTLPPDTEETRGVEANIAEAQALLAGKAPASAALAEPLAAGAAAISGTVRIAPTLAARVSPDDTLLVYAKALAGPPMPLAILRTTTAKLPLSFRLDDTQAMLPELRLSNATEVVLTARVSRGGGATPQSGDLEGVLRPVKVGAAGLDLVVDQVVR